MVVPLILYITCNLLILRRIQQQSRVALTSNTDVPRIAGGGTVKSRPGSGMGYTRARKNVAITLLYTLGIHVLAATGNQTLSVMTAFGYPIDTKGMLFQILRLMTYVGACTNPYIYVIKYGRFRAAVATMLRCLAVKICRRGHDARNIALLTLN
jgi:hypothetical protein